MKLLEIRLHVAVSALTMISLINGVFMKVENDTSKFVSSVPKYVDIDTFRRTADWSEESNTLI